jgi:hypothetical protein
MVHREQRATMNTYSVSCHCGRVQAKFRRKRHLRLTVWDCNCSDCEMRRNLHFMVHASDFWLVDGSTTKDDAATGDRTVEGGAATGEIPSKMSSLGRRYYQEETILYQWGTRTAIRRFCRTCGILPFYIPRSNQDGYAVTLPCVDWGEDGPPPTEIRFFDGINWERSYQATCIAAETATDP